MKVKVSNVKRISPPDDSDMVFRWKCTECNMDNEGIVKENTLLQYKKRNLGLMMVKRRCEGCGAEHSMGLTLARVKKDE